MWWWWRSENGGSFEILSQPLTYQRLKLNSLKRLPTPLPPAARNLPLPVSSFSYSDSSGGRPLPASLSGWNLAAWKDSMPACVQVRGWEMLQRLGDGTQMFMAWKECCASVQLFWDLTVKINEFGGAGTIWSCWGLSLFKVWLLLNLARSSVFVAYIGLDGVTY